MGNGANWDGDANGGGTMLFGVEYSASPSTTAVVEVDIPAGAAAGDVARLLVDAWRQHAPNGFGAKRTGRLVAFYDHSPAERQVAEMFVVPVNGARTPLPADGSPVNVCGTLAVRNVQTVLAIAP